MDCSNMNEFCKFICQYNDQISLFVNAISSIAMVATVIVALCANKQSNKQLKSALEMQEQSKNIELYEKRLEIIKIIYQFKIGMGIEEIQMLPIKIRILYNNDEKILEKFDKLKEYCIAVDKAEEEKKRFITATNRPDGYGGYTTLKETIEEFEMRLGRKDYDVTVEESFRNFCGEHICQITNPETNNMETVNYCDIHSRLKESYIGYFDTQTELIKLMEQFINNGLQPITKDKGRKKNKK